MKKILKISYVLIPFVLPMVTLATFHTSPSPGPGPGPGPAAGGTYFGNVSDLLGSVTAVLGLLTPIIFALAIIYFFWGLAKFILAAGDEEARANGKKIMLWGIIAIFVMVSVYGIVAFISSALNVNNVQTVNLPQVPQPTAGLPQP